MGATKPSMDPQVLQDLRDRIRGIEGPRPVAAGFEVLSTGFAALDQLLTDGGLRRGALTEWLGQGEGAGAVTVALAVAAHVLRQEGALVVIDGEDEFYPVAAAHLGVPLDRTVVVRPDAPAMALWAWEQSLRCPGVAVTFGRLDATDDRVMRRLQLAAEAGGGLGFFVRPPGYRSDPSWATARICVRSAPTGDNALSLGRRLQLWQPAGRRGARGSAVEVELAHETAHVHRVPQLAHPAAVGGAAVGSAGPGGLRTHKSRKDASARLLARRPPARGTAGDAAG